jgi:hypothetical protein
LIVWGVIWNFRERRRQLEVARKRPAIDAVEFRNRLVKAGAVPSVAEFVWDQFQPCYFEPLTPYPDDRPIGEFRIDPDDLSDMVTDFEKKFGRRWRGEWIGPEDPTLTEFARGLMDSTSEN